MVCDSVSCWVMGYEKLLEHMTARLGIKIGGTTEDGLFTLLLFNAWGLRSGARDDDRRGALH